ncbi:ser/Thr protein phosphatase [Metarhizium guizhouense ARSEF 977]|uniref:Ser/Thr protein phosphatase n=1 Tax=Metarhizium guizhouense (strain ARSEF 977) TaxID=1276136 RepID=A0A0B4GWB1_METGA|nr:ser/Thr protein phosphatase [Metarhizium guizhouense ARSEF 977]
MDLTPIKVAAVILERHGISMCIVGELALNYYNVPRVCHVSRPVCSTRSCMADDNQDLEICVSKSSSWAAVNLLCSTGLFNHCELDGDFNNFTEYKRNIPRVRTTGWCPPQTMLIFTAAFFGFDSIENILISPMGEGDIYFSKEMQLNREDITNLHLPRLAPLLKGLARRFLDTKDDVAMIAVEQLVDGMDIDEAWVERHLGGSDAALLDLVKSQIRSKKSRIDYYTDNKITCFVSDQEEAEKIRLIPGFE